MPGSERDGRKLPDVLAVVLLAVIALSLCAATGTATARSSPDCSTVTDACEVTEKSQHELGNPDQPQSTDAMGVVTKGFDGFTQIDDTNTHESMARNSGNRVLFSTQFRASNNGSPGSITDPPTERQPDSNKTNESMENIDSTLVRLIGATDRKKFAKQSGIDYRNGRARIVVEMEENSTFPGGYNTTNELNYTGQGENLAQAHVPVDDIVSLSDETGVERVRLPMRGVPNQGTERDEKQTADEDASNNTEDSEIDNPQDSQQTNESDDRDGEGLPSVMGGILPALIVIMVAAYGRRKL